MPDHHPAPPQDASVGALVELSRYSVATGERVVRGQRILGVVRITDAPADGAEHLGCPRSYRSLSRRPRGSPAKLPACAAEAFSDARWKDG